MVDEGHPDLIPNSHEAGRLPAGLPIPHPAPPPTGVHVPPEGGNELEVVGEGEGLGGEGAEGSLKGDIPIVVHLHVGNGDKESTQSDLEIVANEGVEIATRYWDYTQKLESQDGRDMGLHCDSG